MDAAKLCQTERQHAPMPFGRHGAVAAAQVSAFLSERFWADVSCGGNGCCFLMASKDSRSLNTKAGAGARGTTQPTRKAKKTTRNSPAPHRQPLFSGDWIANTNWPELMKDLTGLAFLLLGLVILFSLVSHNGLDKSTYNATGDARVHNYIGPVGANIAASLFATFGWLAVLMPLLVLGLGWVLLRPPEVNLTSQKVLKLIGWLCMLVAVVGLLTLSDAERPRNGYYSRGGWIGDLFVRQGLVSYLNELGALLLLTALLIAGLILSTRFSLSWLPQLVDDLLPGDQSGWFDWLNKPIMRTATAGGRQVGKVAAGVKLGQTKELAAKTARAQAAAFNKQIIGTKPIATPALALTASDESEEEIEVVNEPVVVAPEPIIIAKNGEPSSTARTATKSVPAKTPATTPHGNGNGAAGADDALKSGNQIRTWPTSLRGDQVNLPTNGAAAALSANAKRSAALDEDDLYADVVPDDFDDDATYAKDVFPANEDEWRDADVPPPPRAPGKRSVEEMLASATVKRIEPETPAVAVKESKLSKALKTAAQLMANYRLPGAEMLTESAPRPDVADDDLMDRARQLAEKCAEFNVSGKVTRISPGPVVTTFEFKPDPGVKYSRITGLVDDLCLGLKAESVRIDRIPGKSTVGIEVPNLTRETIRLREVIESREFREARARLPLALGKTIYGANYVAELEKMPHLLIAGATGAGKSVGLNSILISLLYKASPNEVKLILVDPKRLELGLYADIPHLLTPIVTDAKRASYALKWAVAEMENRYKHLAAFSVRNIEQYNQEVRTNPDLKKVAEGETPPEPLPYIVIIIDELADLMMVSARDVEESITRLAQMARAVGIHLILATQRPSVDVITGLIKANFPSRIAFRVSSKVDSRTIIDSNGAEGLLGQGDMLFLPPGTSRLVRVHGAYVDEKEVKRVCDFIRAQGSPAYDDRVTMSEKEAEGAEEGDQPRDEKYYDAVKVVIEMGRASTSALQRRLRIGYGRAASIIDMMEREGIVGPEEGASKPRQVLVKADFLERVEQIREEQY